MQKKISKRLTLTHVLLVTSLASFLVLPFQASASGSYSPKASGSNLKSAKNQYYHYGKQAVQQKLLCSSCPLSSIDLNATQAKQILTSLYKGDNEISNSLTRTEQKSITVYLKRRFGL